MFFVALFSFDLSMLAQYMEKALGGEMWRWFCLKLSLTCVPKKTLNSRFASNLIKIHPFFWGASCNMSFSERAFYGECLGINFAGKKGCR